MYQPFYFLAASRKAAMRLMAFCTNTRVQFAECFCCPEQRDTYRFGGNREEWAHLDDDQFADMRHVHVESAATDCDGRYSHGHVLTIWSIREDVLLPDYLRSEYRTKPDFDDLWSYVTSHVGPRHSYGEEYGPVGIEIHHDRMSWSRKTDEGGEWGEALICGDWFCDAAERLYVDHTAERAGY